MTGLRSCWLCWLALVFATVPLQAEEHDHDQKSAPPHAIADGTTFLIRIEDKLDVSRVQPGKRFKAKLEEDMMGSRRNHDSPRREDQRTHKCCRQRISSSPAAQL
jgi:hypothetical protein